MFLLCAQNVLANSESRNTYDNRVSKLMGTSSLAFSHKSRQSLKVTSRKQATAMVKARYKAKVLSVNSSQVNGNPGYRAKLLSDNGTVFYVSIDAKTGRMKRS